MAEMGSRPRIRILHLEGDPNHAQLIQASLEKDGFAVAVASRGDRGALRKSEDQFRHAQKMEAVGRLAAGVAHDFNNLLTAIIGYTQLIQRRFPADHPASKDAGEVLGAAERAASLTRQLLIFSRQEVLEPQVLDLNRIVTDIDRLLRRLIGADVNLLTAPAPDLGRIRADAG